VQEISYLVKIKRTAD